MYRVCYKATAPISAGMSSLKFTGEAAMPSVTVHRKDSGAQLPPPLKEGDWNFSVEVLLSGVVFDLHVELEKGQEISLDTAGQAIGRIIEVFAKTNEGKHGHAFLGSGRIEAIVEEFSS